MPLAAMNALALLLLGTPLCDVDRALVAAKREALRGVTERIDYRAMVMHGPLDWPQLMILFPEYRSAAYEEIRRKISARQFYYLVLARDVPLPKDQPARDGAFVTSIPIGGSFFAFIDADECQPMEGFVGR